MDSESILGLTIGIVFLSLPFIIWYSVHKENNKIKKVAKNIKPGDMYIFEYRLNGNPFSEPYVSYARVEEIKLGFDGDYWVKYRTGDDFIKVKSQKLRAFLCDFKPIKYNDK